MLHERRRHSVVADGPQLLEALAVPFGTYSGVAVCRPVPGARCLEAIAPDLLCAVGKTEALTRAVGKGLHLVEVWFRAHEVTRLFVTGADGLGAELWHDLCGLGDDGHFDIVFVSAEPWRWVSKLAGLVHPGRSTYLAVEPDQLPVQPGVGAVLPEVGFPGLPAACAEVLEAPHAARAQAIYDECLVAAFEALPFDRLLEYQDADHAFRCALARTPELGAVVLAMHAVRAAGILRGYHISFCHDHGVVFDDLLTADRLAQLGRLVSPEPAAAGVLAGMASWSMPVIGSDDGAWVKSAGTHQVVPAQGRPLLRAWLRTQGESRSRPRGAPPRPTDERSRQLWRTPPPTHVRSRCEPIDCRPFRRIAEPPMGWTRPPRPSRRRNGRPRSASTS
ncbi:MAG: hypothetical protein KY458_14305 [Actinobacteria bacterium]|nr:hypothetical protein [Actinomycetota bacterium]